MQRQGGTLHRPLLLDVLPLHHERFFCVESQFPDFRERFFGDLENLHLPGNVTVTEE